MKNDNVLPNNTSHPIDVFYIEKKGRKNSAPKDRLTVTFSPDGAIIVLNKSNLGSHSEINFFNSFESIIGILSINLAIIPLSSLPSIETICL